MVCSYCLTFKGLSAPPSELCPNCLRLLKQEFRSFSNLPYQCPSCGVGSLCEEDLCFDCREQELRLNNRSFLSYKGLAKVMFQRVKFSGQSKLLAHLLPPMRQTVDNAIFIPMPPNPRRMRSGGRDVVQALAAYWAGGRPVLYAFGRKGSREHKGLALSERRKQEQLFLHTLPPKNRPLVLVDDILTTGSTLERAYTLLEKKGYKGLRSLTLFCRSY
jgi:competence protein ComFC